jgi:hypothetical protein
MIRAGMMSSLLCKISAVVPSGLPGGIAAIAREENAL